MLINIDLRWVICQIQEQCDALHGPVLLEVAREEARRLQVDTHGAKHDREVLLVSVVDVLRRLPDQASLPADLRGDLVMRETGGGEDGDLLPTGNRVHGVDG